MQGRAGLANIRFEYILLEGFRRTIIISEAAAGLWTGPIW